MGGQPSLQANETIPSRGEPGAPQRAYHHRPERSCHQPGSRLGLDHPRLHHNTTTHPQAQKVLSGDKIITKQCSYL